MSVAELRAHRNSSVKIFAGPALRDLMRVYMANRGICDAIHSASPSVSLAAEESDIDICLSVYEAFLDEAVS